MPTKTSSLLFIALLVAACGKSGPPRPPVPLIPKSTSDLVVAQRGPKTVLGWSYPGFTTSGAALRKIDRVVVYRYVEALPATLSGRDPATFSGQGSDPGVPPVIALFQQVPPLTPQQFTKLREKIDSRDAKGLPDITFGGKLIYEDDPPFVSVDGRPNRITYGVVTEGVEGKSDLSNLVSIIPLEAASAPENLTATAGAQGVVLRWTSPRQKVKGKGVPELIGYNIYRFPATGNPSELGAPVNGNPVKELTYTDVPPFGGNRYLVTAVSAVGPPRQEGDPAGFATIEFGDLQPPPVPENLVTLVEEKAIRLVWDGVEASDLAGYKIYRVAGTVRIALTRTAVSETNFRDSTARPGVSYIYSVVSVDDKGNESPPVAAAVAMIPR
ncbi:MAG TPA: hypothetical protein VNM92_04570 [Thermoanaerobaculia bacterium]|nr:hypothetical protein [Thermoanaerobaculia bacterium]